MKYLKLMITFSLFLLLFACQSDNQVINNQDGNSRNDYHLWAEKLYVVDDVLSATQDELQQGRVSEASALLSGFNMARQRISLYERLNTEVYSHLEEYYNKETVDLLEDIDKNLHDISIQLPEYLLESSNHDEITILIDLIDQFKTDFNRVGGINDTATNSDLSLYNIYAYPGQIKENNSLKHVDDLVHDMHAVTNNIVKLIQNK